MKRFAGAMVGAALLLCLFLAPAGAQSVYAGAGVSFPVGDYGDFANTGWNAMAGVTFPVMPSIWVGGEVSYGQNDHEGDYGKTNPLGVFGQVGYTMSPFYVFGGLGLLVHRFSSDDFSESESKFGGLVGAGVDYPIGRNALFLEGRFVGVESTSFAALMAGISIPFGRRD
jgi:opacity protein-like surface antigen